MCIAADETGKLVERRLFARNYGYQGQPVMLTEFGGISISENQVSWGYTHSTIETFYTTYERIINDIYDSELIVGYCYTQLADIEQETNGLLNEEHDYKFDPERMKHINDKKGLPRANVDIIGELY